MNPRRKIYSHEWNATSLPSRLKVSKFIVKRNHIAQSIGMLIFDIPVKHILFSFVFEPFKVLWYFSNPWWWWWWRRSKLRTWPIWTVVHLIHLYPGGYIHQAICDFLQIYFFLKVENKLQLDQHPLTFCERRFLNSTLLFQWWRWWRMMMCKRRCRKHVIWTYRRRQSIHPHEAGDEHPFLLISCFGSTCRCKSHLNLLVMWTCV